MFEHKTQPLLTRAQFIDRLLRHGALALGLIAASLLLGILGYRLCEHLSWLDAFLNAAMLLGGMGPVNTPITDAGKLFAGLYALYCGLVVIVVAGILLAPAVHRLLHRVHLEQRDH